MTNPPTHTHTFRLCRIIACCAPPSPWLTLGSPEAPLISPPGRDLPRWQAYPARVCSRVMNVLGPCMSVLILVPLCRGKELTKLSLETCQRTKRRRKTYKNNEARGHPTVSSWGHRTTHTLHTTVIQDFLGRTYLHLTVSWSPAVAPKAPQLRKMAAKTCR